MATLIALLLLLVGLWIAVHEHLRLYRAGFLTRSGMLWRLSLLLVILYALAQR